MGQRKKSTIEKKKKTCKKSSNIISFQISGIRGKDGLEKGIKNVTHKLAHTYTENMSENETEYGQNEMEACSHLYYSLLVVGLFCKFI